MTLRGSITMMRTPDWRLVSCHAGRAQFKQLDVPTPPAVRDGFDRKPRPNALSEIERVLTIERREYPHAGRRMLPS